MYTLVTNNTITKKTRWATGALVSLLIAIGANQLPNVLAADDVAEKAEATKPVAEATANTSKATQDSENWAAGQELMTAADEANAGDYEVIGPVTQVISFLDRVFNTSGWGEMLDSMLMKSCPPELAIFCEMRDIMMQWIELAGADLEVINDFVRGADLRDFMYKVARTLDSKRVDSNAAIPPSNASANSSAPSSSTNTPEADAGESSK